MKTLNIIGAGLLGKSLGALFIKSQMVKINGICNTSAKSAIEAIEFIGAGHYVANVCDLPPSDITLIATKDDQISPMCEALCKNPHLKKGSLILHCSGVLTSNCLDSARKMGCLVASVHPMRSFANPQLSVEQYKGTFCAIEGSDESIPIVEALFGAIGSITYRIDKNKKTLYHAAGVVASNYLVTLAHLATLHLEASGIANDLAIQIVTSIMKSTLSNLDHTQSPKDSLTGPIKRGDMTTIKQHLSAIQNIEQKQLYMALGKATVALTSHTKDKQEALIELFLGKILT